MWYKQIDIILLSCFICLVVINLLNGFHCWNTIQSIQMSNIPLYISIVYCWISVKLTITKILVVYFNTLLISLTNSYQHIVGKILQKQFWFSWKWKNPMNVSLNRKYLFYLYKQSKDQLWKYIEPKFDCVLLISFLKYTLNYHCDYFLVSIYSLSFASLVIQAWNKKIRDPKILNNW